MTRRLYLLLAAAALALHAHGSPHRAPQAEWTLEVPLQAESETASSAAFDYQSENLSVAGDLRLEVVHDQLSFRGRYRSRQGLEAGVNLAFQIYLPDGKLLFREGGRAPFVQDGDGSLAEFDYRYPLNEFELPQNERSLVIQFNYVKEGEYWADQRFPEIELAALLVGNIDRGENFEPILSWTPHIIPRNLRGYSFHWFSSQRFDTERFRYLATLEAFYATPPKRVENPKLDLVSDTHLSRHILAAPYRFEEAGAVDRRLGFIWPGTRWYRQADDSLSRSYVVPVWLYAAMGFAAMGVVVYAFQLSGRLKRPSRRRIGLAASAAMGLLFLIEFTSGVLPTLLLSLGAMAAATSQRLGPPEKTYWILALSLLSLESYSSLALASSRTTPQSLLISLALAALLPLPALALRRPWLSLTAAIAALFATTLYYLSVDLYYAFFQDYPSLNILGYAHQGASLGDSIANLLEDVHSIFAIQFGLSLALLIFVAIRNHPRAQAGDA